MDFTTIKAAGLSQAEFADLCGVSRVTANLWIKSRMAPNRYLQQRVADVLAALQAAAKDGRLPLNKESKRDRSHRAKQLKEIVDSRAVTTAE